ncbi:MAG TPA: nuclear transport factor 2 family protein, partial [Chitinophagaceae bacterium]|nr:nuclear transport factor 2 family protein [Chitinophagaceae bacterium]
HPYSNTVCMSGNKQIIEKFYTAFQQLDYKTMQNCYSDDIIFSDPVFLLLKGNEAKAMWEMLCKNARDFSLSFSDIELIDHEYATCSWTASYTFTRTGRKVVNNIKAFMRLKDGKIIEHSDGFRLSTWAAQALGWKGVLFGWTGFMKRGIQKNARRNLAYFIQSKNASQN